MVFSDTFGHFVFYLDDILIGSLFVQEHQEHFQKASQRLPEVSTVNLLGYVISLERMEMEPARVSAVLG